MDAKTAPEAAAEAAAGAGAASEPASASAAVKNSGSPAAAAAAPAPAAAAGTRSTVAAEGAAGAAAAAGAKLGGMSTDLLAALTTSYPKINKLIHSLKGNKGIPKTPLMVLHEYATKMSYEVSYVESTEGTGGPYQVETKMVSQQQQQQQQQGSGARSHTVVQAVGKARTKKDAKQLAAAACLERLLEGPRALSPQELLPAPKNAAGQQQGRGGRME